MCNQQSLRSACAYAQSDKSLCLLLEYSMIVKLLTEHHLEFLSLKGSCTDSSESTHVKMPHCWKSHSLAHMYVLYCIEATDLSHLGFPEKSIMFEDIQQVIYCIYRTLQSVSSNNQRNLLYDSMAFVWV